MWSRARVAERIPQVFLLRLNAAEQNCSAGALFRRHVLHLSLFSACLLVFKEIVAIFYIERSRWVACGGKALFFHRFCWVSYILFCSIKGSVCCHLWILLEKNQTEILKGSLKWYFLMQFTFFLSSLEVWKYLEWKRKR